MERGEPVMVRTGTLMCYGESSEGEQRQRFVERLGAQPELDRFPRCLRLFLAGLPEFDPRQPDATAVDELPNTPGAMVRWASFYYPKNPTMQYWNGHTMTHIGAVAIYSGKMHSNSMCSK